MKLLVAGDFCPQNRVAELFNQGKYDEVLGGVKDVISAADYSVVNFECPITKGGEKAIEKCGPNLHCSEQGMEAVQWAGFKCMTLANNHFLDFGGDGVENTLKTCGKYKVDHVGGGNTLSEAAAVLYKKIGDHTLAIINCCEHEFSIATEKTAGSNPLNPVQQYYAIKEAQKHADFIVVIVHGGNEYYQLPSPRMKETYRFFIDAGADAVVNHHQHCFSGYEYYKDRPIVYGLGNFCFDEKGNETKTWTQGYMAEIDFAEKVALKLIPYYQCGKEASVRIMSDDEHNEFLKTVNHLNQMILDDNLLSTEYGKFLKQSHANIELMFSPYSGRIGRALCRRGLLPSFMNSDKKKEILGFLQCESHLPKIMDFLTRND